MRSRAFVVMMIALAGCTSTAASPLDDVKLRLEELQASQASDVADLTTECMIGQGYDDFVAPSGEGGWAQPPLSGNDGEPLDTTTLEFAETHGFGVVSNMLYIFENDDVPPELFQSQEPDPADEDPEYLFAYWSGVEVDRVAYDGGCYGWANREWERLHPEWAAIEPFGEAWSEYDTDAENDPRIVAIEDVFAACMRPQGFDTIRRRSDLHRTIRDMIDNMGASDNQDRYIADMERIREYDIEMAVVAWHCGQEIDAHQDRITQALVEAEYEARFVNDHPELLEPFK